MANKVVIDLKPGLEINDLEDGVILVYDATKGDFYTVTEDDFFDKYEKKLNDLLIRYDEVVAEMKNIVASLKEQQTNFINNVVENNSKLINMTESFLKGE